MESAREDQESRSRTGTACAIGDSTRAEFAVTSFRDSSPVALSALRGLPIYRLFCLADEKFTVEEFVEMVGHVKFPQDFVLVRYRVRLGPSTRVDATLGSAVGKFTLLYFNVLEDGTACLSTVVVDDRLRCLLSVICFMDHIPDFSTIVGGDGRGTPLMSASAAQQLRNLTCPTQDLLGSRVSGSEPEVVPPLSGSGGRDKGKSVAKGKKGRYSNMGKSKKVVVDSWSSPLVECAKSSSALVTGAVSFGGALQAEHPLVAPDQGDFGRWRTLASESMKGFAAQGGSSGWTPDPVPESDGSATRRSARSSETKPGAMSQE
jgi:hypothetical protein